VVAVKDAPRHLLQAGVKLAEGIEDHRRALVEGIPLVGGGNGGVEVVAAQPVHANQAGFQPEEALENHRILPGNVQQGVHHFVGQVVGKVAGGNRLAVLAQPQVFGVPVPHQVLVNLPQNGGILPVHPVQFLVGAGAHAGVRLADVHHQLTAGHLAGFSVYFQLEGVAVGDG